ncbi:MAG: AMP-binding protein [Bacteroidota bacterium]
MLPFKTSFPLNLTAIVADDGTRLTYRELSDFSESVNQVIKHRCLVFCLCQNTPGSLSGYISLIAGRIVPVMLDSKMNAGFLAALVKQYEPRFIWLPDHRLPEFTQAETVFSGHGYSLVKLRANNNFPLHHDLAMLLTTSGSTGSPKFVRISYDNMEANAASIADYLSIDEHERPITTLPMSYAYGLSVINSHILKRSTILLTSKTLLEKEFWTFLKTNGASSISGIPYTYKILDRLQFIQMHLPSVKTLTQAGGKLQNDLFIKFATFCAGSGKQFFTMYGQTEATARMGYLPAADALSKPGSIGKAIPGGEFSLADDNGTEINGSDIAGELVYKGRNVSMGYSTVPGDLIKGDENHGILFTGDLAIRDEDQYYYLVGRKRRFIKVFGSRISLDETERLLENIVPECACTGVDDRLVVHLTDMTRMAEVKKYVSSVLGVQQTAVSIRYCAEIPKNEAGKTHYAKLDIS